MALSLAWPLEQTIPLVWVAAFSLLALDPCVSGLHALSLAFLSLR